jgi:hypothetical protein
MCKHMNALRFYEFVKRIQSPIGNRADCAHVLANRTGMVTSDGD